MIQRFFGFLRTLLRVEPGVHYQGNTVWIDVEVAEARVREAAVQHRALWDHWVALSRNSRVTR